MGVPFRIVLYADSESHAAAAAEAAFKRVADLNAIMSDYETDSEISKLSRTSEEGSPVVPLSDDLWKVLSLSQQIAHDSAGAFDITIGPCVALWRKARREEQLPDPKRLENARHKVGFTNLVLFEKDHSAQLLRRGMRLDLGAIAKGYAADEALKTLRQRGIKRALVAASGDLAIGDPPPGEKGWRVEIGGYDATNGPPALVTHLANRGVSTSGDAFQRLEINGIRYSHIIDPFTCIGMTNHALATVIARNDTIADGIDTTCTILEPAQALALARKYDAEVRIIRMEQNGPVTIASRNFPAAPTHK